jgi:hypothetical protein
MRRPRIDASHRGTVMLLSSLCHPLVMNAP